MKTLRMVLAALAAACQLAACGGDFSPVTLVASASTGSGQTRFA